MNIKIVHSWLLDYIDTQASPKQIAQCLSLCGPSVENLEKINGDYVYDIEITSNRPDTASVYGLASEAYAILPQFGYKTIFQNDILKKYSYNNLKITSMEQKRLNIKIKDSGLCPRFSAIVIDNITIKPSPAFIKQRLELSGLRSINNIVDISNYLMLDLGQPVHVFDYDLIGKSTMILRASKKNEKITIIDGRQIVLPGNDIIIEDGNGNIIDLCGIMGGLNSAVSQKTKTIVLFVQNYNPTIIRRTIMTTGVRTDAATLFEKGLDPYRVEPALVFGTELYQKYADGQLASNIYDIYPNPYKNKSIIIDYDKFNHLIGVNIPKKEIKSILVKLGFSIIKNKVVVPSSRFLDVNSTCDLVEEVARIYGYYKIPSALQSIKYIKTPKKIQNLLDINKCIRNLLKFQGSYEVVNYSMISKTNIENLNNNVKKYLRIKNAVSSDIEYLRTQLLSSLLTNLAVNQNYKSSLTLYELSKIYKPQKNKLPQEKYQLGIISNAGYLHLKGLVDSLLKELNITDFQYKVSIDDPLYQSYSQTLLLINNQPIGYLGKIKDTISASYNIDSSICYCYLDIELLNDNRDKIINFIPLNPYSVIKLDLNINLSSKLYYQSIKTAVFKISSLVKKIEVVDIYQNKATLRFYFNDQSKNLTEDEAKQELEKINKELEKLIN